MELGVPELMVILVIALLIWGPGKLPQLGRSLGEAIREFKRSIEPEPPKQDGSGESK